MNSCMTPPTVKTTLPLLSLCLLRALSHVGGVKWRPLSNSPSWSVSPPSEPGSSPHFPAFLTSVVIDLLLECSIDKTIQSLIHTSVPQTCYSCCIFKKQCFYVETCSALIPGQLQLPTGFYIYLRFVRTNFRMIGFKRLRLKFYLMSIKRSKLFQECSVSVRSQNRNHPVIGTGKV